MTNRVTRRTLGISAATAALAVLGARIGLAGGAPPAGPRADPRPTPRATEAPDPEPVLRPEDFGAEGDGSTDDTAAFALMARRLEAAGGGTVILRRVVYRVGVQDRQPAGGDPAYGYAPRDIFSVTGCRRALVIRGNEAILRAAPGLRYGTFDRSNGRPIANPLPNYRRGETAAPYYAMVHVARCTGPVLIERLELDGNGARLSLGGPFGDSGRQIPGSGIILTENHGDEILRDIAVHDHPLDGLIIDGTAMPTGARSPRRSISGLRARSNGRQGCSIIGGIGYRFIDCAFTATGKGGITSAPAAGVDIEPENGKVVRSLRFERCTFADNAGCGMLAESGDAADLAFIDCQFVGTTNWSAWPRKPGVTFERCLFVGSLANAFGAADPRRACRFAACTFRDADPAGRYRTIYLARANGPVADLSSEANVRFDHCRFLLERDGVLPWSTAAIYADCTMTQRAAPPAYPRGTYLGTTQITGNVDLNGSRILGNLSVNGRPIPRSG